MKREPIDPADIREGDLVRCERGPGYVYSDVAHEYVAISDGDMNGYGFNNYYLLDRQTLPVVLPSDPTLGWITTKGGHQDLDFWRYRSSASRAGEGAWAGNDEGGEPRRYGIAIVGAFTPATAVPTEALDELERAFNRIPAGEMLSGTEKAARDLLDAVDKAAQS